MFDLFLGHVHVVHAGDRWHAAAAVIVVLAQTPVTGGTKFYPYDNEFAYACDLGDSVLQLLCDEVGSTRAIYYHECMVLALNKKTLSMLNSLYEILIFIAFFTSAH